MDITAWTPLLVGAVGSVAALGTAALQGRKIRAEADAITATTTLSMIRDLRVEMERLSARLAETEQQAEALRARAEIAEHDVGVLHRAVDDYRCRVDALVLMLEQSGARAPSWDPPDVPEVVRHGKRIVDDKGRTPPRLW